MPKTSTEKVRVHRQRRRAAGMREIKLWVPDADLVERFGERLKAETLAVELEVGELRVEKAA